jgi:hypothetical protein
VPYGAACSEGLWIAALLRPPASGTPKHGANHLHMAHRHYGVPVAKPRPSYSGPTRAATLSGGAIVGGIVVILIVLGLVLYGVTKTVTDAVNTTTSAPRTTGQGSRAL